MIETVKTIGAVVLLAICIGFLAIVIVAMFRNTEHDERNAQTRYNQTKEKL